ncbi:MAG: hypothetical protein LBR40_01895 [Bacilli bacterium]|nr:hypothetical protein [Bacilli bacterium]
MDIQNIRLKLNIIRIILIALLIIIFSFINNCLLNIMDGICIINSTRSILSILYNLIICLIGLLLNDDLFKKKVSSKKFISLLFAFIIFLLLGNYGYVFIGNLGNIGLIIVNYVFDNALVYCILCFLIFKIILNFKK